MNLTRRRVDVWAWVLGGVITASVTYNGAREVREMLAEPETDLIAIDGDTIEIQPGGERVRLYNVDTPERHCRCPGECLMAEVAKEATQTLLDSHDVTFKRMKLDRYGRTVAAVFIDGNDLGEWLIAAGLGRPYHGEKRLPWCK